MNKKTALFLILIIFISNTAFPQFKDMKDIETELVNIVKRIDYLKNLETNDKSIDKWDSLSKENSVLTQKLYDVLKTNRNSVYYDFSELRSSGMYITSSSDKNLRIFSWDTKTGGTMVMFNSILQYNFENKISAKILNNVLENNGDGAGYYFTIVYKVKPNVYLAVDNAIYSTMNVYMGIRGLSIENGTLNDTFGIFKTKQGLVNETGTGYDFFSVVNIPFEQRPQILYDEIKQVVSVPMTDFENDLTGQYIKFLYNGTYFAKENLEDRYIKR